VETVAHLARLIDHTLLTPDAGPEDIRRLCDEGRSRGFGAVCVNSLWVPLAADLLAASGVRVASVCGFPLGASSTRAKAAEAMEALREGAREVSMVISIGDAKAGRWDRVEEDVSIVADGVHAADGVLKVILECALLADAEKEKAAHRAAVGGADLVTTSTGFLDGSTRLEDVALLRQEVGAGVGVQASGDIRTVGRARALLAAGASRLGTSFGIRILEEAAGRDGG